MTKTTIAVIVLGLLSAGFMIADYSSKKPVTPPAGSQPLPPLPTPTQPKKLVAPDTDSLTPYLADAKAKNLNLFLVLSKEGCIPCARLSRTIDRNKDLFDKHLILKMIDSKQNDKFKVAAFPTVVVLDGDGKELARSVGYMTDGELKKFLAGIPAPK